MKQAPSQGFIKVADFVVFPVAVLDWGAVESANELDASDCTLSGSRTTHFFSEDGIVVQSEVPDLGELVESIECLPVVDEIVFH